jgi:hypothetical protein
VISVSCKVSFSHFTLYFFRFLTQLSLASYATPASALTTVDVKVFRHEFISIFRFAEYRTLHPTDITILEPIDEQLIRYEEDNETVFLARDVMERMKKLSTPRRSAFSMQPRKQRGLVTVRRW